MKTRIAAVVFALCVSVLIPSVASASPNCRCQATPDSAPALELLEPTSSTALHAGQSVNVEFTFIHVYPHPSANLVYKKKHSKTEVTVALDLNGKVTVPSDWSKGRYELVHVDTDNSNGSRGVQWRDGHFSGLDASQESVNGCSPLNLKALDLRIL